MILPSVMVGDKAGIYIRKGRYSENIMLGVSWEHIWIHSIFQTGGEGETGIKGQLQVSNFGLAFEEENEARKHLNHREQKFIYN